MIGVYFKISGMFEMVGLSEMPLVMDEMSVGLGKMFVVMDAMSLDA